MAERNKKNVITVKGAVFGAGHFCIIAGPCAVESEDQTLRIARAVKEGGAHVLRGGAFKPRSSPKSFQGLGARGLKILKAARAETGLPIVTELVDVRHLDLLYDATDIIQVGARNMQNFALLKEVGRQDKPVLLKRGMAANIDEWLMAAEYISAEGNQKIILCERGLRHHDRHSRFLVDLGAVPIVQKMSQFPVIVDPSHGAGRKHMVAPLARAALAVGAQAVMVDVHDRPREALCDAQQALSPREFKELARTLCALAQPLSLKMPRKEEVKKPILGSRILRTRYEENSRHTWA